ncbi:hypothetical protein ACXWO6_09255, partial [Streptococcus pyogenes]
FAKELLDSLGILDWGYTEESLPHTFKEFELWSKTDAGSLNYLQDHRRDLRSDLTKVYPEFESALVFLFSYQEEKKYLLDQNNTSIAGYSV